VLDSHCDDLKSGKVEAVDGEAGSAQWRKKKRTASGMGGFVLHPEAIYDRTEIRAFLATDHPTAALSPQGRNSGNNFGTGFILSGWSPWPGSDYSAISQEKPSAILDDLRGPRNLRVIGALFFRKRD
jgi:hypothetical protein